MRDDCIKGVLGLSLLLLAGGLCAQTNLQVKGMGWLENRSLKSRLAFLQDLTARQAATLDAALLEDSAFLLIKQLQRDGYQQPSVVGILSESDRERRVEWTTPYTIQLDADTQVDAVTYVIEPGLLAYYDSVDIQGVVAIEPKDLQRYFIPGGVLVQTRRAKVFTLENLDRRIGRVVQTLQAAGYGDAQLVERAFELDPQSGAVRVSLVFEQGPLHYVGRVVKVIRRDGRETETVMPLDPDTLLTSNWEQAQRSALRNEAFAAGYPDAKVTLQRAPAAAQQGESDTRIFDYRIVADWGEAASLGAVRFSGDADTRRSVLRSRLKLAEGEPLDRLEVDQARRRMMGLGIYRHVAVDLEPAAGAERDVVYALEPGLRQELQLLGGWGSYEQARIGFSWEHRNPFGRAHRYQLDAKQSLKSTQGQLSYSIPQVFSSEISGYANAGYNFREEISYDRANRGVSLGAAYNTPAGWRLAAEYGFYLEEADRRDSAGFISEEDATVSSVRFSVSYDQRDDVLAPGSGWHVYSEFKVANRLLGGSVDFVRWELGGSYHFALTDSTLAHLGLRGGAILSGGERQQNIPFNERFFLGGENSLRGYREGEASPLDADGDQIGAESYALLNLELEQRIFPGFSTIVFLDSLHHARDQFSGETQLLHSLGLGLRYQTVIGPIRLEYGHNLNPREQDADGSVHLSIGFPF